MKKKFTTTLDEDLIKKIKILAIKKNTSVATLIENSIKKLLKENGH